MEAITTIFARKLELTTSKTTENSPLTTAGSNVWRSSAENLKK
jgi:hypothetical protein